MQWLHIFGKGHPKHAHVSLSIFIEREKNSEREKGKELGFSFTFKKQEDIQFGDSMTLWCYKVYLIYFKSNAGKDWGKEEKGTTEDEMVRWHHWLNGHGFG